ncbi:MAG: dipeptidase [Candidatus Bipolaricaulota bacterium]|nr:dipeptidase [Candidatus Bipolaricaulota bacterium]
MKFFDTHCDTVMKVMDGSLDFLTGEGVGHVSLPGMLSVGSCAQVFACFVNSKNFPGKERDQAEAVIAAINRMIIGTQGKMQLALDSSDIHNACAGGRIAALICLEGANPLDGDPEALRHFYRLGVRNLIIAWQDNPFSGSAFGTNTPLTKQGKGLVELAEELHVMIDVSHLSDRAFDDVFRITSRPFIASHSNCRHICPHRRNLTDDMIHRLADRGGVMGINLAPLFLDPVLYKDWSGRTRKQGSTVSIPRTSLQWVVEHIRHAMNIGGEDCVGLGGDLDGISSTPDGIEGIDDYPLIPERLFDAGLTTPQVEKVCWRNFERVFCEVLPD